jgi:hypothetical protein
MGADRNWKEDRELEWLARVIIALLNRGRARCRWLTPIILAMWEAEIIRIAI